MMRASRIAQWLVMVALFAGLSRPVLAQEAEPSAGDQAVALGKEGVALFERGQWEEALARFRQAEALYHSPVFVVFMARSLRAQGELLEARVLYQKVVAEELAADAVEPWKQAQADAREELSSMQAEIPRVVVVLEGEPTDATITLDGQGIQPGESVEVDPGTHRVLVVAGDEQVSRELSVAAGDGEVRVPIQLGQPPSPPPSMEPKRDAEPWLAAPPATQRDSGLSMPGLVVTAVGGAVLLTGGVFGVLALRKKSDNERKLPASCQGKVCFPSQRSSIEPANDDAKQLGKTADILFIGGAALAAVGVSLLILDSDKPVSVEAGVVPRAGFLRVKF